MVWDEADGMSLRDWFAGQALAALVSARASALQGNTKRAYAYADAMLAARST